MNQLQREQLRATVQSFYPPTNTQLNNQNNNNTTNPQNNDPNPSADQHIDIDQLKRAISYLQNGNNNNNNNNNNKFSKQRNTVQNITDTNNNVKIKQQNSSLKILEHCLNHSTQKQKDKNVNDWQMISVGELEKRMNCMFGYGDGQSVAVQGKQGVQIQANLIMSDPSTIALVFELLDADCDGAVGVDDFKLYLKSIGSTMSQPQIHQLFELMTPQGTHLTKNQLTTIMKFM